MSPPAPAPVRPRTVRHLMVALVGVALVLALVVQMGKLVRRAREAALLSNCSSHFKWVGLALINYESAHQSLPPAYTTDPAGRPLLSWRVLILPFSEDQALYNQFHLDEPWDSPHNLKLLDRMPPAYACPTHQPDLSWANRGRFTNMFALSAPGTILPGPTPARLDRVTDGPDNTLMLVESAQAEVPWTAPVDLDPRTGRLTNWMAPGPPGPPPPTPPGSSTPPPSTISSAPSTPPRSAAPYCPPPPSPAASPSTSTT